MKELMKRYEKYTNADTKTRIVNHSVDEIVKLVNAIPEPQPVPVKYVIPLLNHAMNLQAENAKLKAQLTWRPVSEPTVKADWYLTKLKVDDDTLAYDVSWSDGKIFGDKLVVAWLPIPEEVV